MGALRVAYVIFIDQKVVDQGRVNNRLLATDVIKFNQEYVDLVRDNFIMSLCSKIIYQLDLNENQIDRGVPKFDYGWDQKQIFKFRLGRAIHIRYTNPLEGYNYWDRESPLVVSYVYYTPCLQEWDM